MKIKIAHCADIHIGAECTGLGEEKSKIVSEDIKNAFFDMLKICEKESVDALLISGDLFDDVGVKNSEINNIISEMAKCSYKIFISPGNHDPYTPDSPYERFNWPENVVIFKGSDLQKVILKEKNVAFYGFAFQGMYEHSSPFKNFKPDDEDIVNICVMHGDLGASSGSKYNLITHHDIKLSKLDYVALGHIHKRTEILSIGQTRCAYSGNLQGTGFDELGERGFYIGTIEKNICNLEFRKACVRTFEVFHVDVSGCEYTNDFENRVILNITQKYGENYSKNIYKIVIEGEISENAVLDLNVLNSRLSEKLFFAEVIDNTRIKIDVEKLKFRNDFKSLFIKKMLEKIENSENEDEKNVNTEALKIGLLAFEGEDRA